MLCLSPFDCSPLKKVNCTPLKEVIANEIATETKRKLQYRTSKLANVVSFAFNDPMLVSLSDSTNESCEDLLMQLLKKIKVSDWIQLLT